MEQSVSTAVAAAEQGVTETTATTTPTPDPHVQELPPTGTARRIELRDAWKALDSGDAVIVDVRGADQYQAGHIPGAIHIPEGEILNRLAEIPIGKTIITYCT